MVGVDEVDSVPSFVDVFEGLGFIEYARLEVGIEDDGVGVVEFGSKGGVRGDNDVGGMEFGDA